MIAPATKKCSACDEVKAVTAFPPNYPWCRECKRASDRERARRIRGSKPRVFVDHGAVCVRLRAGVSHRDVAREFNCVPSTVKRIAKKNGLQRTGKRPLVSRECEMRHKVRELVNELRLRDLTGETTVVIGRAVEAYRDCGRWCKQSYGRRTEYAGEYRGLTAEMIVDAMTQDWKERVRLLNQVVRMATKRG